MSYNLYETTIFTNIFQDYETDIKYIQTNDCLYLPINKCFIIIDKYNMYIDVCILIRHVYYVYIMIYTY